MRQGFEPLADEWVHARCEFNKLNTKSSNHDSLISSHQPRAKIPHHQASNFQIIENSRITNCQNRILAIRYLRPSPRQRRTIHQLPPDGTMEKCHCLSTAKMLHPATATTLVERNWTRPHKTQLSIRRFRSALPEKHLGKMLPHQINMIIPKSYLLSPDIPTTR